MRMWITSCVPLIIVCVLVFVWGGSADAQEGGTRGLAVSPLTFEISANPGEEISNVIKVFNRGSELATALIQVEDFAPVGEEGQVALQGEEDGAGTYSLASWVSTNQQEFRIEPGSFASVEFTIAVPVDAEPGGHYGSILATITAASPGGGGTAVAQKVGSLLLVNVAGDVREELSVRSFEVPEFSQSGPIEFVARFENTGSVHLKPRGFIFVKNMLGREVAKLDLPQQNVLPGSTRRVQVLFGQDQFLFGKYEATLTGIYGTQNEPFANVVSFWVVPVKLVASVGAGALAALILLFLLRKRIALAGRILLKGSHES